MDPNFVFVTLEVNVKCTIFYALVILVPHTKMYEHPVYISYYALFIWKKWISVNISYLCTFNLFYKGESQRRNLVNAHQDTVPDIFQSYQPPLASSLIFSKSRPLRFLQEIKYQTKAAIAKNFVSIFLN